jgi:hypothetical protein
MAKTANPGTGDSAARNAAERQARSDFDAAIGKPGHIGSVIDSIADAKRLEQKRALGGSHPDSRNGSPPAYDGY